MTDLIEEGGHATIGVKGLYDHGDKELHGDGPVRTIAITPFRVEMLEVVPSTL